MLMLMGSTSIYGGYVWEKLMGYFNYHAKLKKLLSSRGYEVIKEDNNPFAYRFNFDNGESMPIRSHRVGEYLEYI